LPWMRTVPSVSTVQRWAAEPSQDPITIFASLIAESPASVTHKSCKAQVFYNGDSPAYSGFDWDPGYYKGQCPPGQYVAGISTPAFASNGIVGAAHAILCCNQ